MLPLRLNQFVIYIILPAIILLRIPMLDNDANLIYPMLGCWLVVGLSALAVLGLAKHYKWPREVTGALLMVVPLGNTSFLGFPAIKILLGEQALPHAILYDQLGNFVALAVYGSLIISLYGNQSTHFSASSVIRRVFSFPPFLCLLVALCIPPIPTPWQVPLQWCAAALIPVSMLIIGLQFRLKLDRRLHQPLAYGLTIKMLLAPLVLFGLGTITGQSTLVLHTTTLEAGMPPMVTAGIMAMGAGFSARLSSGMVGLGMILAFVTLPLIRVLLGLLFQG